MSKLDFPCLLCQGGVENFFAQTATKKERGEEAPMPRTVRGLPQTLEPGPSSRFQPPRPFERLPLCLFRKVLVVRRWSRIFPSGSSDVEENSLTPQLSSAVVRLVLEVKLRLFLSMRWRRSRCSIRCPVHALDFHHFGKSREGKVRFVRVLQSPPLPLPLKSRVCRCLQSVPSP